MPQAVVSHDPLQCQEALQAYFRFLRTLWTEILFCFALSTAVYLRERTNTWSPPLMKALNDTKMKTLNDTLLAWKNTYKKEQKGKHVTLPGQK